jgi:hypothetical protein
MGGQGYACTTDPVHSTSSLVVQGCHQVLSCQCEPMADITPDHQLGLQARCYTRVTLTLTVNCCCSGLILCHPSGLGLARKRMSRSEYLYHPRCSQMQRQSKAVIEMCARSTTKPTLILSLLRQTMLCAMVRIHHGQGPVLLESAISSSLFQMPVSVRSWNTIFGSRTSHASFLAHPLMFHDRCFSRHSIPCIGHSLCALREWSCAASSSSLTFSGRASLSN